MEGGQESKTVVSRLGPSYRYHVNGPTPGGTESTFQEDLLKLINPDLIASENSNQVLIKSDVLQLGMTRNPLTVSFRSTETQFHGLL